jgi:hypothetical protein
MSEKITTSAALSEACARFAGALHDAVGQVMGADGPCEVKLVAAVSRDEGGGMKLTLSHQKRGLPPHGVTTAAQQNFRLN